MNLIKSMIIAASGMKVQSDRMRVISENIANSGSTAKAPGDEPYRRKIPTFTSELDRELDVRLVKIGKAQLDKSEFGKRYDPGHPAADDQGYIETPNVNSLVEMMDMREAQRSYEANLNIIDASRRMAARTLDLLRS